MITSKNKNGDTYIIKAYNSSHSEVSFSGLAMISSADVRISYTKHSAGGECEECGSDRFTLNQRQEFCLMCNTKFNSDAYLQEMIERDLKEQKAREDDKEIISQFRRMLLHKQQIDMKNAMTMANGAIIDKGLYKPGSITPGVSMSDLEMINMAKQYESIQPPSKVSPKKRK